MNNSVIEEYMRRVQAVYDMGDTTEHSYRAALGYLFDSIDPDVNSINEPKAMQKVGRPDFVFKRTVGQSLITLGHCEAKDINKDVTKKGLKDYSKEQFARYIKGLPNLIYTNGLDFVFYVKGELVRTVSIGDLLTGIQPKPDQYALLAAQLTEFVAERLQTITSAKRLAELMAGKALMIKEALFQTLRQDPDLTTELAGQYKAFKDQLIHDLTPEGFADIYAETVAYGMFAARLHDDTLEDFSREEALELLPKSNPFLRDLFGYVAGPRLDERIRRDIDELAEIFQATDLQKLFADFGSFTKRNDPFIHFYETFLAEYNPKKRKARGVWYTPEPVVNFIVRAVDDVLKTEFGLPMGLADTSKITVDVDTGQTKTTTRKNKVGKTVSTTKPLIEKREMHRVQILDPATGTGTFLAEVIKQIAPKIKDIAPGKWSRYVEQDLIPRIHGFELLMASYAMCHMKLDMMLSEMGYKPTEKAPRLSVYLTNSLEEGDKEVRDLFMAQWLSNEAKAANEVKRDKPIMCIIGNPPYSGESANKGEGFEWIEKLLEDYKTEAGGKQKLKERNPKWLNDDYVKFIRYSQNLIAKNEEGVLAFITNNGYLDNPTFRGMRWNLSDTFDTIYIFDLHGSMKKREVKPDGAPDKNIFDIQQGVSIIVAVKSKNPKSINKRTYYCDVLGSRAEKGDFLWEASLADSFEEIDPRGEFHLFVPRDYELEKEYNFGFSITELMTVGVMGFQTHRDFFVVNDSKEELRNRIEQFENLSITDGEITAKYSLGSSKSWDMNKKRTVASSLNSSSNISKALYRPFDQKFTSFDACLNDRPRPEFIKNVIGRNNLLLGVGRQGLAVGPIEWCLVTVSDLPMDANLFRRGGVNAMPLYLYPEDGELDQTRRVNMNPKIRKGIEKAAKSDAKGVPDEVVIFDYIYGVLHCPSYRETYAEFLKIDFPRIPYPSSPERFWDIAAKGKILRRLHLIEDAVIGETPYAYSGDGDDIVEKPEFEGDDVGMVSINDTQSFENVPRIAWEFYIGGYQPAQKWLKDRKGRELSLEDIMHYRKIIKILSETDRIMKTIEMDL